MSKLPRATIVFYNETTRQLQLCTVPLAEVRSAIDRQTSRGFAMNLPLGADDDDASPITNEVLQQIGGMAVLNQGMAHPELRSRFQFDTPGPMVDWDAADNRT
ncbi:hypothetical protein [Caballeronia sp. AZ10_KS36]|uniref:hypothetical protein n=1 Tax=Caballeronia sp. AZ10_KS36 TaxID=2921757 RepID=UPI00202899E8|nr:hypothetical protein [Caballeronia sp. AZ10_KS36]